MRNIKRFLPAKITKVSGNIFRTKEEILEIEHLKNVVKFDFELGNLLYNVMKAEEKFKNINFEEIPF